MDELTMVKRLREQVPPADLTAARAQFRAGLVERPSGRRVSAPRGRLRWGLLAAGAAGVVGVAAVIVDRQAAVPDPASSPPSELVVAFMDKAADVALLRPARAPRPDQFVHFELQDMYRATMDDTHGKALFWLDRTRRNAWYSVSGQRPGLDRVESLPPMAYPGRSLPPESRLMNVPRKDGVLSACGAPSPLQRPYLDGLPTDPHKLLALMAQEAGDDAAALWQAAERILMGSIASPPVLAALFRAIARIPGATLVPSSTDAVGRQGVAVARIVDGERHELIFDPKTYSFLGQRGVVAGHKQWGAPVGSLVMSVAILKTEVVDNPPEPGPGAVASGCRAASAAPTTRG